MEWLKSVFTQEVRGYIYRVLIAVGVALVGFGAITGEQWALIGGVLVAVLNIMPAGNTSIKK
jgi:hypothetical protein